MIPRTAQGIMIASLAGQVSALAAAGKDKAPSAESQQPIEETPFVISVAQKQARLYPADRMTPQRWGWIRKQADIGYVAELQEFYDAVAEDAHASSVINTRKLAVAGAPWCAEAPDKKDKVGVEIAAECEKSFRRTEGFTQLRADLMDAVFRGYAGIWPRWSTTGPMMEVVSHQAIEARFFRFADDLPNLMTAREPSGEPLPPGMLFFRLRDKPGAIARAGFGPALGRLFIYKGFAGLDAASFLERFGHPYVTATIPRDIKPGTPELEGVKNAIRNVMVDQFALVSPGVEIKLLDSLAKAATIKDTYLVWIAWLEASMSKAALGQVLTTSSGDGGLGHGGEAKEQGKVRQDLLEVDAQRLDEFITATLFRAWTTYNYGPDAPSPRMCTDVAPPEDEKASAEASNMEAETFAVLQNKLGLSLSEQQMRERFGALKPANEEDALHAAPPPAPAVPGAMPPGAVAALAHRQGACPHCGGGFTLAAAEKKKRSLQGT